VTCVTSHSVTPGHKTQGNDLHEKNSTDKGVTMRIGEFDFDPRRGTLGSRAGDQKADCRRLEPQVSELLKIFAAQPGQVLSRELLTANLWPDRVVSDEALRATIKKLREALRDNARDPQYIKTLPLRGYSLIAPISHEQSFSQNKNRKGYAIWAASALFLVLLMTGFFLIQHSGRDSAEDLTVRYLTRMSGSEVSPDYDPINSRLIFSHRANKVDYLQLYVKDLSSGQTTRLTSEQANYANALWAPDGNRLLFTRSDSNTQTHYLAEFSPEEGITQASPVGEMTDDMYLMSWARNGQAVYFKEQYVVGQPQGIRKLHLSSGELERITTPSSTGKGDAFALESHDGQFLAILRSIEERRSELLILHLATGELVNTLMLPDSMDRLVWGPDDKQLTLSNFAGKLIQYQRSSDQIREIAHDQPYLNHIFHQCGSDCFYMRQHNGNYLDLGEQVNPFSNNPLQSAGYFEAAGLEDFPLYGPSTQRLYFVSQHQGTLAIRFLDSDKNTQLLITLPEDLNISALTINQQETMLAGLAGNRVFTVQISAGKLEFITSAIDKNYPPLWTAQGDELIYARLENNNPVLYRYSVTTREHVRKESGYQAMLSIDKQRDIKIDAQLNAYLVDAHHPPRLLAQLPSVAPNRWQVRGDWLYYSAHTENLAFLHRVSISTGKTESERLAKNRFRLNFDLNHSETTLAIVRSRLADSNLVEVRRQK